MKPIFFVLIIALLSATNVAHAQTFNEWFKQKKTQRKYLLAQIAELQIYLGYLKKGYDIARDGLYTIRSIKNGEWDLHKVFFGSLKIVNPKIKNYAKVAAIIDNQQRTIKIFNHGWKGARSSGQFSASELDYYYKILDRVLAQSAENLDQLIKVTTNAELEMTDDERIAAIDKLYDESQHTRTSMSRLCDNIRELAVGKIRELDRTATLRILHDVKN